VLLVGLTGGIATGKSRVRARLADQGFFTLDLDQVAHAVTAPGRAAHADIAAAFGPAVLAVDGTVDRRALAAVVFSDAGARERLNAIVHPRIFEEEARLVAARVRTPEDIVVVDATLLVEGGYHLRFDRLVVTHCDRRRQIARLMQRDGLSAGAAQARVESQMAVDDKARYGHFVVETTGELTDTDAAADRIAAELRRLAADWPGPAPLPSDRAAAVVLASPSVGPGLTAAAILEKTIAAGAPLLAALARALRPRHRGPWYDGAGLDPTVPLASGYGLMCAFVPWSLAWHGTDVDALVSGAVSMARLTHSRPVDLASLTALALALCEAALAGGVPRDLRERVRRREALIERWAGAGPSDALRSALETASGGGGAPEIAGPLQAIATGGRKDVAPPAGLLEALRVLEEQGRSRH
jgi:dephospho-CoA kinase